MNLSKLLEDGIISQATLEWLKPLWEQEQADRKALQLEKANQLTFCAPDSDDEDDDMEQTYILRLGGLSISYQKDEGSVGHGNRVWHASIATCFWLSNLLEDIRKVSSPSGRRLRCIELGAGTAIPSLFFAHLLSEQKSGEAEKSLLHITDAKQYRNIRQILLSVTQQPSSVLESVQLQVSPHNWGGNIEERHLDLKPNSNIVEQECSGANSYDLVIVSDCIYNPDYHDALLASIASTLRLPSTSGSEAIEGDGVRNEGGRAIVTFSLHGNVDEERIWDFLTTKVPRVRHGMWRLLATPIEKLESKIWKGSKEQTSTSLERGHKGGWLMEDTMKDLDLWIDNMDPLRWIAFAYEITWEASED